MKIIVRMPNWIGDVVMATPVLADLRAKFPDSEITAMCRENVCALLEKDPNINELFCFTKGETLWKRMSDRSVVNRLRCGEYDIGIALPNSFSSAYLFVEGGVKRRVGFASGLRNFLLTDKVPFPEKRKTQHLVETYKAVLKPLGIERSKTLPKLYVSQEEEEIAWEILASFGVKKGDRIIGVNPGSAYGEAKCWLPDRFREVARRLAERGDFVVLFGDGRTHPLCHQISLDLSEKVIDLSGRTNLRELMSLIKICKLFLTNDSGPMHIAAHLDTPLIALFGSTDPVVTGPYGKGVVIQKDVPCAPCFSRICPIDFPCMKRIATAEVLYSIDEELNK